jgi:hypothetical protein
MNWISIKEKLPSIGQPVLLYNANAIIDAAHQQLDSYQVSALIDNNGYPEWKTSVLAPENVSNYTHWMPLPEPPIPEDEQTEAIKMVADSVLGHHVPHDARLQEFKFNIAVEGIAYEVSYLKDTEGYWTFNSYQFLR